MLVLVLMFAALPVQGAFASVGPGVVYIDFGPNGQNVNTFKLVGTGTDSWVEKKPMPKAIHGAGIVSNNNKIYLVGGRYIGANVNVSVNSFQEYDPINDSWSNKTVLPESRGLLSSVIYDNKIIAIGGNTPNRETTSVIAYDFTKDSWVPFPSLNEARSGPATTVFNNKIYVFGGGRSTTSNSPVGSVEIFGGVDPLPTSTPIPTVDPTATPVPTATATPKPTPTPTPEQPTGNRAIVVVTMNTGLEKEFDLSMEEVNSFIAWYENKQSGTGTASYAIDKHGNNKGPFTSRKEYVIFDKILTFEVSEYTAK